MGASFSAMFNSLFGSPEVRVLVLGLGNAGKTTIIYWHQKEEAVSTSVTVGFNVETVQYNNINFQFWDKGGQMKLWPNPGIFCWNMQAVIFIVDSSDTNRIGEAKEDLHAILEVGELKGAAVLVFANKQDLPGALDDAAVTEALELQNIKNHQWALFKACATKGEGLFEGMDWLCNTLKSGRG